MDNKKMACQVCYESFNNSTHKLIECPKGCDYKCCKQCIRTYFKDIMAEPHCMNCKVEWESEFVVVSLNKSYFNGEYKENRKTTFMNIEKSRLPDTQQDAKLFVLEEEYKTQVELIKNANKNLQKEIHRNNRRIVALHSTFIDSTKEKSERKTFIMKCQSSTCNGFLSSSYKCELCNKHTCSKCFDMNEEGHECKPENVETVNLMKKETKACPKCAVRIYKIDGCDQMWCVECNTAFSWISGKIVNGTIHNPHYYDYLKTRGAVPRAAGDVLCGGLPAIHYLRGKLSLLPLEYQGKKDTMTANLYNIHQFITHIHHIYLGIVNDPSHQNELRRLRILHILDRMDEKTFKEKIYREHKKNSKNQKKLQLLQMVDNVGTDLFQNFAQLFEKKIVFDDLFDKSFEMIYSFSEIITYFNKLVEKYSYLFGSSIGQIGLFVNMGRVETIDALQEFDIVKYRY